MHVGQAQLDMRWATMSDALQGLMDFAYDYAISMQFTVLDDKQGVVGSGSVGRGYAVS